MQSGVLAEAITKIEAGEVGWHVTQITPGHSNCRSVLERVMQQHNAPTSGEQACGTVCGMWRRYTHRATGSQLKAVLQLKQVIINIMTHHRW